MNAHLRSAAFIAGLALTAGLAGCSSEGLLGLNCVTEIRFEGGSPETVCDDALVVTDDAPAPAPTADDVDHEAESDASEPIRKRGEKADR